MANIRPINNKRAAGRGLGRRMAADGGGGTSHEQISPGRRAEMAPRSRTPKEAKVLIADAMNPHPVLIRADADLHEAAEIVAYTRVSDLMVIGSNRSFAGVLSQGDILRAAMPQTKDILAEGGTLETAYELFLARGSTLSGRPIEPLVITQPMVVGPGDHVAKAATLLLHRQIQLLPVVDGGRLAGTVSRADICRAVVGLL